MQRRLEQGYPEEEVMRSIQARSRDNARTPMQWTAGEKAGFTTGDPWMPINPNYVTINAEAALADENSVFHYYKKLIALRKTYGIFGDGDFRLLLPEDEKIFAYTRNTENAHLLVVCNFTDETLDFEVPEAFRGARLLISNCTDLTDGLQPYEACMLYYESNV